MKTSLPEKSLPIIFAQSMGFMGTGAILPVLPVHLVNDLQTKGLVLGLILGIFPFAALGGRFIGGWSTDVKGRRQTVIFCLLGVSLAGFLLILPLGPIALFIVRLVQGFFQGAASVAAVTWIMDVSNDKERPHSLAMIGAGVWGGTTLGVMLGGFINSLPMCGLVAGVITLLGIPALKGTNNPEIRVTGNKKRTFMPKASIIPGTTFGLGATAYSAVIGFLVLHLNDNKANGVLALTFFTGTVLVGRFVVVPIATRFGLQRSVKPVLFISSMGLVLIAFATSTWQGVLGVIAIGIAHSVLWPALASVVGNRVSTEERGAAVGFMTGLYDIAVGISSVIYGLLATHTSTKFVFLIASIFVICAIIFDSVFADKTQVEKNDELPNSYTQ
jgi:MFS family permease